MRALWSFSLTPSFLWVLKHRENSPGKKSPYRNTLSMGGTHNGNTAGSGEVQKEMDLMLEHLMLEQRR